MLFRSPTGLRPIRLHKGILMEAIHLRGRSGHSSDPSLGNNALEGMHAIISELLRWRAELQAEHRNPLFAVPVPTLNLDHIHGGDNPNRICADCELHIDLRPLPGMEYRRCATSCKPDWQRSSRALVWNWTATPCSKARRPWKPPPPRTSYGSPKP